MSTADLGERPSADQVSSGDLAATYEKGFSLLKDATLRESQHEYQEARKLYVDGCEVFMKLKEVEKDPKKKDTIRKNLKEFITAAERVSKKLDGISPEGLTQTAGETGANEETGESRMEIIRPGSKTLGKQQNIEGEPQKVHVYKDAEMGEGIPFDNPVVEIAVRKNSRSKLFLFIFGLLTVIAIVILVVVLTGNGSSSSDDGSSYTMTSGWRFQIEMEISGLSEGLSPSQVEDQISLSLDAVEAELDLDTEEVLLLEVLEDLSQGSYRVLYSVLSQIEGNADIYKTYIKENLDLIEEIILEAIFGSSATVDQTIEIDDTDEGLVIVVITASPSRSPTGAPSEVPTRVPTGVPTTMVPTNLPTLIPTVYPTLSPTDVGSVYKIITWLASICCLLESEIDNTVSSIAAILSLETERIDVGSYSALMRRSESESVSTWNIAYLIFTYSTDDPNFHLDIINRLEDASILDAIADHITSNNLNATISTIETLTLTADEASGRGILMMVLYFVVGGLAIIILACCAYKCFCPKK